MFEKGSPFLQYFQYLNTGGGTPHITYFPYSCPKFDWLVRISFSIWGCRGSETWKTSVLFALKITLAISRDVTLENIGRQAMTSAGFNDQGKFKCNKKVLNF